MSIKLMTMSLKRNKVIYFNCLEKEDIIKQFHKFLKKEHVSK